MNFIFCNVCCIYNMLYSIIYIYICVCVCEEIQGDREYLEILGRQRASWEILSPLRAFN